MSSSPSKPTGGANGKKPTRAAVVTWDITDPWVFPTLDGNPPEDPDDEPSNRVVWDRRDHGIAGWALVHEMAGDAARRVPAPKPAGQRRPE